MEKCRVENFMLIVPKRWDLLIKADRMRTRQYLFVDSMDPENMIKENYNTALFIFEYFAQKDISGLIDERLGKICIRYLVGNVEFGT